MGVALSALDAVKLIGMPEADCIIAQTAVYLARAPKSREVIFGFSSFRFAHFFFYGNSYISLILLLGTRCIGTM